MTRQQIADWLERFLSNNPETLTCYKQAFEEAIGFLRSRGHEFQNDVVAEYQRARQKHSAMHSLHEALGVIYEEFDEFKLEVWKRKPDPKDVYTELVQLSAMAQACAIEVVQDKMGYQRA